LISIACSKSAEGSAKWTMQMLADELVALKLAIPVVCMDEQPTQLIKETRRKIAVEPGKVERVDYGYALF